MADHFADSKPFPDIHPPFAVITRDDQGGLIVVMAALAASFVLVAVLLRLYLRIAAPSWNVDDFVFLFGTALALTQSSMAFAGVHTGWGKSQLSITPQQFYAGRRFKYANDLIYIFSIYCSKCTLALLYFRLTVDRQHRIAAASTLAACTLWIVLAGFLVGLRCHPSKAFDDYSLAQCSKLWPIWQTVSAMDIITEVMLVGMAVYMVYGLQMRWQRKMTVVAAFGTRLLLIPFIALRLVFFKQAASAHGTSAGQVTIISAHTSVCTQLEIGLGFLFTIIPILKPFLTTYDVTYNNVRPSTSIPLQSNYDASTVSLSQQPPSFGLPSPGTESSGPLPLFPNPANKESKTKASLKDGGVAQTAHSIATMSQSSNGLAASVSPTFPTHLITCTSNTTDSPTTADTSSASSMVAKATQFLHDLKSSPSSIVRSPTLSLMTMATSASSNASSSPPQPANNRLIIHQTKQFDMVETTLEDLIRSGTGPTHSLYFPYFLVGPSSSLNDVQRQSGHEHPRCPTLRAWPPSPSHLGTGVPKLNSRVRFNDNGDESFQTSANEPSKPNSRPVGLGLSTLSLESGSGPTSTSLTVPRSNREGGLCQPAVEGDGVEIAGSLFELREREEPSEENESRSRDEDRNRRKDA